MQTNMSAALELQEKSENLLNIVAQFQIGNDDKFDSKKTFDSTIQNKNLKTQKAVANNGITARVRNSSEIDRTDKPPHSTAMQTSIKMSKDEDWAEF